MNRRTGTWCEVCRANRELRVVTNKNEKKPHVVCRRHIKKMVTKLEEEFPDVENEKRD